MTALSSAAKAVQNVLPADTRPTLGTPSLVQTGRAILQLSMARTVTPVLVITLIGLIFLPMLFGIVFASRGFLSGDPVPFLVSRYDTLVSALATPIIALLLSTSAFSAEADDGTLLYLVTTTTPRWWIVVVRLVFAMTGTALASALAIFGTGYLVTGTHDPDNITLAFGVAAAFGGAAYAAIFTMLALLTRRALVAGLIYIVFWETVLSATFPALKYVSVRQWMASVAGALAESNESILVDGPSLPVSLVAAGVMCVASVYFGARRLSRPRVGRVGT